MTDDVVEEEPMTGQLPLGPVAATSPASRTPAAPRGARRKGPASDRPVATREPVARVLVDTGLAHLDRPFEYAVPADLDEDARPGTRVRVRFAGRDHDGYLLERADTAEHEGRLAPLRRVVSPEPVLTPQVLSAARSVADHYGGTLGDVLRLAVPPRHARAERSVTSKGEAPSKGEELSPGKLATAEPDIVPEVGAAWRDHPAGAALLRRIAAGEAPWAAWTALPCRPPELDWPVAIAEAVAAAAQGGRGAVVVVPDHRDVDRVVTAVERNLGEGSCARLTADQGPEARYRSFVQVLRGRARVAVGTRSAAWAPVQDVGLFICWDDADDLHQEPRSPYPHVREVLRARARVEGAALVLGGLVRSVPVQAWVADGTVADLAPATGVLRRVAPKVLVAGEGWSQERDPAARSARVPSVALRALRSGLERGPVLVQVPRQGYVVSVACADCRTPARCPACDGPLGLASGASVPACVWCGRSPSAPGCRECGSTRVRSQGVGSDRMAEELGRALPGVTVVRSGGGTVLSSVPATPVLVVATPGAEPVAERGYAAVVLLDAWRLLDRPSLDAGIESLRRWCAAGALAAPGEVGCPPEVVLVGAPPHAGIPAVEALVRWDPVGLAARELGERAELGLPPVGRHVSVRGPAEAVSAILTQLQDAGHRVLGAPVPAPDDTVRAVVREGGDAALTEAVAAVRAARSLAKAGDGTRLVLDGPDLLG